MKRFDQLILAVTGLLLLIFLVTNLSGMQLQKEQRMREYRVEISRLQNEIEKSGGESIQTEEYQFIKKVIAKEDTESMETFLEGGNSDYVIRFINGTCYRVEYEASDTGNIKRAQQIWNTGMAVMALIITGILFFVRFRILRPFHILQEAPYELSKGNLSLGLKENKNRYFGKFVWGLNLLREQLEEQKEKELKLQKEKKTLILSISHDIKTPLSAIKLYARALSGNLYNTEEKLCEVAEGIQEKAIEIETFVAQITEASRSEILNMEVKQGEFYLDNLMKNLRDYYKEKLKLLQIEFEVGAFANTLVRGDLDRGIEVLQNMMENAIKYGDKQKITISVAEEEGCQLITVKNGGCQLPEQELPHIFDSFWRGSNVNRTEGSGLGLYICRQLMKKMDGDIFAVIEGDEIGVTAVFRMG